MASYQTAWLIVLEALTADRPGFGEVARHDVPRVDRRWGRVVAALPA
jgi:hypothetical protein